jgi:hypothetical protein
MHPAQCISRSPAPSSLSSSLFDSMKTRCAVSLPSATSQFCGTSAPRRTHSCGTSSWRAAAGPLLRTCCHSLAAVVTVPSGENFLESSGGNTAEVVEARRRAQQQLLARAAAGSAERDEHAHSAQRGLADPRGQAAARPSSAAGDETASDTRGSGELLASERESGGHCPRTGPRQCASSVLC